MVFAKLLHNPGAGEGEHSKEKLLLLIESGGFNCSYYSTKNIKWGDLKIGKLDFIIVAGGDGTIRQSAEVLLSRRLRDKKIPIALLPLGTANNIAETLGVMGDTEEIILNWKKGNVKKFDIGRISNLKKNKFILEGFGFGLFPRLMKEMKQRTSRLDNPDEKLNVALHYLKKITQQLKASHYKIISDNVDYSGEYLLVEVLNTKSIGPNLNLAPDADPGDGTFDLVMIKEDQRIAFETYVDRRIKNGKEEPGSFNRIRAKKIEIYSEEKMYHVDDQLQYFEKPTLVKIEIIEGALDFIV